MIHRIWPWLLGAVCILYLGHLAMSQAVFPPTLPIACAYNSSPPSLTTGQAGYAQCDSTGKLLTDSGGTGGNTNVIITPSASAAAGIAPVVAGAAVSSSILKASAGNLYSAYAVCTAQCWLMVFNSTSAPANGATTSGIAAANLQDCIPIPSGGTGSINYAPGPPEVFSTGITAAISSTACATLTLATTGFIHGSVQ